MLLLLDLDGGALTVAGVKSGDKAGHDGGVVDAIGQLRWRRWFGSVGGTGGVRKGGGLARGMMLVVAIGARAGRARKLLEDKMAKQGCERVWAQPFAIEAGILGDERVGAQVVGGGRKALRLGLAGRHRPGGQELDEKQGLEWRVRRERRQRRHPPWPTRPDGPDARVRPGAKVCGGGDRGSQRADSRERREGAAKSSRRWQAPARGEQTASGDGS